MTILDPTATSMGDLVNEALKESGRIGIGQTPLAEDFNIGWSRLQMMLQQWERKRWLVYHLVDLSKVSTGAVSYTVGPGGDFNTGANSARPDKLESAFARQLVTSSPNQIDYSLGILQSREDYNTIGLKQLQSFPGWAFLDSGWPLATLYVWPVPQSAIYEIHITVKQQLPVSFANQATLFSVPYEYYAAMMYNLALRLRSRWQIPTYPGDPLSGLAKDSLNVMRNANAQIARLRVPAELNRPGIYNIFSDRNY
jgi:hypothetical protein